jgi:hypothetical protein
MIITRDYVKSDGTKIPLLADLPRTWLTVNSEFGQAGYPTNLNFSRTDIHLTVGFDNAIPLDRLDSIMGNLGYKQQINEK